MKMKLTKIVYDHTDEGIKAVNHYVSDDDKQEPSLAITMYTPDEWNDVLYWIRSNGLPIDVVKAIDEVSYG